jgi:DHA2 family methylenomycin A resistance protein-like MFS transporter
MTTATGRRHTTGAAPSRGERATLAAGMFGFFMITIDVSAVNVALATMGRELHTATDGLQWVVDGYTLMFAALLLSAGALSDRIGARRAYACGLTGFTLASVACGAAPSLSVLTGARFVQGCAAAVMLPSSLALVRQAFDDPARRARGIALWTTAGSLAVAAGPALGGVLVSAWSWRGIFLINVPAGLAALVLLTRVPRSPRLDTGLDLGGQATAIVALGGLTYAMISGGAHGYTTPPVLAAFTVAVVAAAAFLTIESRVPAPVVPLRLFRHRAALTVLASGFSINTAWYGIVFVMGLYVQQVKGASALAAGLMFVPMAIGIMITNLASHKLAARSGPAVPLVAGLVLTVGGLIGLLWAGSVTQTAVLLIPFGLVGLAIPILITTLLEHVPAAQAGLAGGVLNASRQMGSAMGVALFGGLVSGSSFHDGMVTSLLISAVLLTAAAVANAVTFSRARILAAYSSAGCSASYGCRGPSQNRSPSLKFRGITCRCKCGTDWLTTLLIKIIDPAASKPSSTARSSRCAVPKNSGTSSAGRSLSRVTWVLGISSVCPRNSGRWSRKASRSSFSKTTTASVSPRTIEQKTHAGSLSMTPESIGRGSGKRAGRPRPRW